MSTAQPCAVLSAHTPLAGTAPVATVWLVIEQHGSYGAKALVDSELRQEVGAALSSERWKGVKVVLARPTGRHAVADQPAGADVWLAHAASGRMVQRRLPTAADLLELDPVALAAGLLPPWPVCAEPRLFICTNGRRDVCCARLGRAALVGVDDDAVWECSQLGGHRFAATGVLLPWGYVYGRLTPASVADVLTEARRGRLHPDGLRGRSSSTPAGQVAELEVRRAQGLWGVGDVAPTAILQRRDRAEVTCRLPKGSEVTVTLTQVDLPDTLPASCGADPVGERRWVPQAPESHWPTPEPICT